MRKPARTEMVRYPVDLDTAILRRRVRTDGRTYGDSVARLDKPPGDQPRVVSNSASLGRILAA